MKGTEGSKMNEFPVKPLMTAELVKLLFLESYQTDIASLNFSPLLGSFELTW
ncbi:MAG: hypothetical protein AAGE99_03115 [Chlamydiota bacterium]